MTLIDLHLLLFKPMGIFLIFQWNDEMKYSMRVHIYHISWMYVKNYNCKNG